MCVSYTRITGNVKSKHKQYDHWHSQDFSTGGQSEGRVWDHGREIFENLRIKKKKSEKKCVGLPPPPLSEFFRPGFGFPALPFHKSWIIATALYPLIATPVTVV